MKFVIFQVPRLKGTVCKLHETTNINAWDTVCEIQYRFV